MKEYYRYDIELTSAGVDEFDNPNLDGPNVSLHLRSYPVVKETPCGVWIYIGYRKFINLKAKKRWACPTQQEAYESFTERKKSQIRILENQLAIAKYALQRLPYHTHRTGTSIPCNPRWALK